MSKLFVDQVDPKTATTLTLGTSGDTVSIPSGVTIANAGTATGFGESNTPYFMARLASDQTLSDGVDTIYQGQASIDSASGWNNSNYTYTIPSGQGGYWYCWGHLVMEALQVKLFSSEILIFYAAKLFCS